MQGRKTQLKVQMDEETREILQGWLRKQKIEVGLAKRARAMLMLEEGEAYIHVAKQVGLAERHVSKWAERFIKKGIEGLYDKPRPGRKPVFSP